MRHRKVKKEKFRQAKTFEQVVETEKERGEEIVDER